MVIFSFKLIWKKVCFPFLFSLSTLWLPAAYLQPVSFTIGKRRCPCGNVKWWTRLPLLWAAPLQWHVAEGWRLCLHQVPWLGAPSRGQVSYWSRRNEVESERWGASLKNSSLLRIKTKVSPQVTFPAFSHTTLYLLFPATIFLFLNSSH